MAGSLQRIVGLNTTEAIDDSSGFILDVSDSRDSGHSFVSCSLSGGRSMAHQGLDIVDDSTLSRLLLLLLDGLFLFALFLLFFWFSLLLLFFVRSLELFLDCLLDLIKDNGKFKLSSSSFFGLTLRIIIFQLESIVETVASTVHPVEAVFFLVVENTVIRA